MVRVLVVDDEAGIRLTVAAFLDNAGCDVLTAEDVKTALGILETVDVDVVLSDIIMPGESGVHLLARIHELDRGIVVVLLTGEPNVETAAEAVRLGAFDYLPKPVSKSAVLAVVAKAARAKAQNDLKVRLLAENDRRRDDLEGLVETRTAQLLAALRGAIGVVTQTQENRDPYTAGHQRRVARLSLEMARALGLSDIAWEGVEMAALVHDVGKIAVPAEILCKPTRLTEAEFAIIKDHPRAGHEILQGVEFPWPIADIVLQHHERLDGSGYPAGLMGDAIRQEARIIGVADVVEAMASHRPYRAALGIDVALEEIRRNRGSLYSSDVADACLNLFGEARFRFEPLAILPPLTPQASDLKPCSQRVA